MFEKELNFFIKNQEEFIKKYNGKVLALKEEAVIGVYDTPLQAYTEAQKEHKLGTFAIQPCRPGPEAYTVTIATRGLFVNA
jgi:hypothetical protein